MKRTAALLALILALTLGLATWFSSNGPVKLDELSRTARKSQIVDRFGTPLRTSYANDWNLFDRVGLERIPVLLTRAVLEAEDRRFFEHRGVDWRARAAALAQNLRSGRTVRGASTVTEQVARLLHPRPRRLWSKWVEGIDATRLEGVNSKQQILEFYLNQVPFASNRRGVAQAARLFFGRDLGTLNERELLALAVMIRSPVRFDPRREHSGLEEQVDRLAEHMIRAGALDPSVWKTARETPLAAGDSDLPVEAPHFVRFAESRVPSGVGDGVVRTTLHPAWQEFARKTLNESLRTQKRFRVKNGAVLLVDHRANEVLAWAVGNAPDSKSEAFDSVTIPRQPGSSLKPFLYALALETGWSPASLINDEPLTADVGTGVHRFRNYSRLHYGPVPLREALANSLNVPAVKMVRHVGLDPFFDLLGKLGIRSLTKSPDHYGEGLALGAGEMTLFELVQAYATLARGGVHRPLRVLMESSGDEPDRRVLSPESATLIANILSDKHARRLEFGQGTAMDFPLQTAVKTGTSTDHRDAWAFAFNYRYTVGVWMGNLTGESTEGLSGSFSPMMVARSLMAKVTENERTEPLALSPRLIRREICRSEDGFRESDGRCPSFTEYFPPGTENVVGREPVASLSGLRLTRPSPGLRMAVDPRTDPADQVYVFEAEGPARPLEWTLNGRRLGSTPDGRFAWTLERGDHLLEVRDPHSGESDRRRFLVK